jgi:asparagine synthase (glutamine-hydrolysing)
VCGICGFVESPERRRASGILGGIKGTVQAMADSLAHRGPDGDGIWVDEAAGIAFGHRRLAIVDLSPLGRQPMESSDGRLVLTYNGEIYNHRELRGELEAAGIRLRGHSDTEVLVEACALWGVERVVRRLVGIFAFTLWDRAERRLVLVRDQIGVKPLYWGETGRGEIGSGETGGGLMFASELKALRAYPGWSPEPDRDALAAYFRFSYVPGPHTIYRGVAKLPPGSMLTWEPGGGPVRIERYWDMRGFASAAPRQRDPGEAADELDRLLRDAIGRQMVADVPLGAFLSGGIDSSTVVALMQAQSDRPVRSFSIGFHETGYDEATHAAAVARHLGTDHTELYVGQDHVRDVIPALPDMFDEPVADSSQIPTFLVSEMTRRHVTVALSGDGGDELFAGYHRYFWADAARRRLSALPSGAKKAGVALLRGLSEESWDRLFALAPGTVRPDRAGDRMHRLAAMLGISGHGELYRGLLSHWDDPEELVPGSAEPRGILWDESVAGEIPDFIRRMQFQDAVTYLPEDILTKVDRASMAVALEARVPLLDHRVVEFAWSLPRSLKIRNGKGKWLLRRVLYRYVPSELVERPKMGFSVPVDAWLRGPLRDWAEDLLDERRMRESGLLNPAPVRRRWAEHLGGRRNWSDSLWSVLMFQAWGRRWLAGAVPTAVTEPGSPALCGL